MSFGGLPATAARYVFEGSNEFKNLPAQQSVQQSDQILRNYQFLAIYYVIMRLFY